MSSGDYYVGHPTTYTAPSPAPAPATKQPPQVVAAGGEQAPATASTQTPGATHNYNYFVGHPVNPEKTPPQPAEASPQPAPQKRSSFLSRWFPCGCGGRASEQ